MHSNVDGRVLLFLHTHWRAYKWSSLMESCLGSHGNQEDSFMDCHASPCKMKLFRKPQALFRIADVLILRYFNNGVHRKLLGEPQAQLNTYSYTIVYAPSVQPASPRPKWHRGTSWLGQVAGQRVRPRPLGPAGPVSPSSTRGRERKKKKTQNPSKLWKLLCFQCFWLKQLEKLWKLNGFLYFCSKVPETIEFSQFF